MPAPNASFSFPLPFDPLRILYGIRQRWYWFLVLPAILAVAGYLFGSTLAENRYSVSLQLIKNEVSASIQMSDAGQAFQPRDLTDDTLLATTYSNEVLRRTGERLTPTRSPGAVKGMVQINKQRNTSLFYLTAHSRLSAQDAVTTVTIWAEEIIRFTDNLQREDARVMQRFLSEQQTNLQRMLADTNNAIMAFARDQQFVDVESQTEAAIRSLEDVRMQLFNARLELEARTVQIGRYREELRAQSPVAADLRTKREELTFLRGRYTDNNPLVQEKLFEIRHLEELERQVTSAPMEDLKQFTGSPLGNNLYLEILALENERITLEKRITSMEDLLQRRAAEFTDLPAKSLALGELRSQREQLLNALALIEGRRKEAAFFEHNAPGYWRVFQKPEITEVRHSSQNVKAFILGGGGAVAGVFIALFFALIWEYSQPGLRSILEAALVTCTRPLFTFEQPPTSGASWWSSKLFRFPPGFHNHNRMKAFWLTQSLRLRENSLPGALFIVTSSCAHEPSFWRKLLDTIHADGEQVIFYDLQDEAHSQLQTLHSHPAIKEWRTTAGGDHGSGKELVVVRMEQLAHGRHVEWLRSFGPYFWINAPSEAQRVHVRETTGLIRDILGPSAGLIVVDASPGRTVPRALAALETVLLQLHNKPKPVAAMPGTDRPGS